MRTSLLTTLLALAALGSACTAVGPARMALPDTLAGASTHGFEGLGGGRRGEFRLDGRSVRYERGADRLSLFGVLTTDKTMLAYELESNGSTLRARCDGRALQGTLGILDAALRPYGVHCRIDGDGRPAAVLDLAERRGAAGTVAQREGRLQAGAVTLQIRSVHELQGSLFQLAQPAGYLLHHEGRAVAALDLSDRVPQLRRAAVAPEVERAVTLAALALGLLWDPAATGP